MEIKINRLRTTTRTIIAEESIRRLLQMLVVNIALSIVVTVLNIIGLTETQQLIFISMCAGTVLLMIINIHLMRKLYYKLACRFEYYMSTYIAQLLFFVVNMGVGVIFDNKVYAWIFSIAKFAVFSPFGCSSLVSALLFHGLMIASIHIAPIGMGWLVADEDYED